MRSKAKLRLMTEEEYLSFEEKAQLRHEYVDGSVFAMTGSTAAHNMICGNMYVSIHGHLRGSGCQVTANDMKVRLQSGSKYYYPDIMVSCEPFESKSVFKNSPVLLIEILSPSTKQTDCREKLAAYQTVSTLIEYVIVHQDRQRVELYRRISDREWDFFVCNEGKDLVLESLPNGPLRMPFTTIYEGYNPPMRVKESTSEYETECDYHPVFGDLVDV